MSGPFPYTYGVSTWRSIAGVFGDRHVIVMVTVTEETPYLSGFLATMTVMTLMTLIYGPILDEGMRRYFVGSLTAST
jgi:hypothetical protein